MDNPFKEHQKELKELYETGVTQREIDAAKQKQKETEALMKEGTDMLKGVKAVEDADRQRKGLADAMLKGAKEGMGGKAIEKTMDKKKAGGAVKYKKGGKITAANYSKEYGKIYRKAVKKMSAGGSTASKRADGCATKGKTKGRII